MGKIAEVDHGAIVEIDRGLVALGKYFQFTPTGLKVTGRPSLDVCGDMCEFLRVFENGLQWAVGDFVNFSESLHGESAAQLWDVTEWKESTIRVYRWVAAKVSPTTRRAELSFTHHQAIAEMEPSQQALWLDRAVQGDDGSEPWSVARLQKEVKKSKSGTSDKEDPLFWVKLEFVSQPVMEACERQLANLGYSEYKRGGPGL